MSWKDIRTLKIKHRKFVKLLFIDRMESCVGEWVPSQNEIRISMDQPEKELLWTYCHEYLHAISDAYEINLTEKQVQKLEKAIRYTFEKNEEWSLELCSLRTVK